VVVNARDLVAESSFFSSPDVPGVLAGSEAVDDDSKGLVSFPAGLMADSGAVFAASE